MNTNKKKKEEKSRQCHNHKPQPFQKEEEESDKRKQNKCKSNKRTKSTKISSLFLKQNNTRQALLQQANFTLDPDETLNTEIHKKSVRLKAPNSVNASKQKHKNQINHY